MLRHAHFYTKGGEPTFAAGVKHREEPRPTLSLAWEGYLRTAHRELHGTVFHSTRKWFITQCERTGDPTGDKRLQRSTFIYYFH
jgi:hypothetical protein